MAAQDRGVADAERGGADNSQLEWRRGQTGTESKGWTIGRDWKAAMDDAVSGRVGEQNNPIDDVAQTYEDASKKPKP